MVFTVSTKHYLGDSATIVAHGENGEEIPVLHIMNGESSFPGPVMHLAANIASVLNGNQPLIKIDTGSHSLHWRENANGVELRLRAQGQGVSEPSVILGANARAPQKLRASLFEKLHDQEIMALLMATMNGTAAPRPGVNPGMSAP